MRRCAALAVIACGAVGVVGCGGSDDGPGGIDRIDGPAQVNDDAEVTNVGTDGDG